MNRNNLSRYEQALAIANGYGFNGPETKRAAKYIFAKMVTGGATIGKANGKMVVFRKPLRPRLP